MSQTFLFETLMDVRAHDASDDRFGSTAPLLAIRALLLFVALMSPLDML